MTTATKDANEKQYHENLGKRDEDIFQSPLLLDIKGAARALSTTTWAVRSLIWDRKIPYIKIGRKFLIDPADLRVFISQEKAVA